jgi:glycosyltransferase involved in cell wall biosynthesis
MPVHDGVLTIDRAVESVLRQTFAEWELIAVDDASTDGSLERLRWWATKDRRVRVMGTQPQRGPGAARNVGLLQAAGRTVAYLDCDDEYYADYLEHVSILEDRADVLVFDYDRVLDGERGSSEMIQPWDSALLRGDLFWLGGGTVTCLGVAHGREFGAAVGGFDENLWWDEDGDLWKRMARAGASFMYVQTKSGRYHIREGSQSRSPRITDRQRARAEGGRKGGRKGDILIRRGGLGVLGGRSGGRF